jgi:hypothetical protein
VAPSAFDGVFQDVTLTRDVRVERDPPETDAAGDPLYDTVEQTLRVIADAPASAASRDSLREQYGASAGEVVLILTCLEPTVAPANVQPGTEFDLTYGGRDGVLRIVARPVETLDAIVDALGEVLYGVWRPGA